jgi:hypothetical protein
MFKILGLDQTYQRSCLDLLPNFHKSFCLLLNQKIYNKIIIQHLCAKLEKELIISLTPVESHRDLR